MLALAVLAFFALAFQYPASAAVGGSSLAAPTPTTAVGSTSPTATIGPTPPPQLSARAAALIDASTGQLLYGYGADRELAIASTTKLMTALVTLERVPNLGTVFTQNDYVSAAVDSQIGLSPGDRMTVRDLLVAMLLPSADDAAEDLAYNVGHGSVSQFVALMNIRARQLGLTHTHYTTPIGLDTPGNYSSARDLATLTRYLLTHQPFFAQAVAMPDATLTSGPVRHVTNRNDLVGRVPWIDGVKTGHTLDAGYVLIGSGIQHGLTLIAPVLGTPTDTSRDADTLALLRWGFDSFHLVEPVRAGTVLARPTVQDRSGVHAELIAAASYRHLFARWDAVTVTVEAPRQLAGPMPRHAVAGRVVVRAGGHAVASIPLLLARALPEVSPLSRAMAFAGRPFTLFLIVLLLAGASGAVAVWRQRTRALAGGTRR